MIEGIKTYGSEELINELTDKYPAFVLTIATTDTSLIPGITGAGATPEATLYTPASDAEYLTMGEVLCCDATAEIIIDGVVGQTPAKLTKACLELTKMPVVVVNAGSKVKPHLECNTLCLDHGGDIRTGKGIRNPIEIYENGKDIGQRLSINEYLVIGESVAAGTTTAYGVVKALGYDVDGKISGSMPVNPHELKTEVVDEGLKNAGITPGECNCMEALSAVGDPTIAAMAGMVMGSDVPVILAGGTQMTATCAVIKDIDPNFDFSRVNIATTKYVVEDESSNMLNIIEQIDPSITVHAVNPDFENSDVGGLKLYLKGFTKEGAGAGGAMFTALVQGNSVEKLRKKIEDTCS